MKTIAIYNEKGGTGKTTTACLFAGYLYYHQGQNVIVYDFDSPSFHYSGLRQEDFDILSNKISSDGSLLKAINSSSVRKEPYFILTQDWRTDNHRKIINQLESLHEESKSGYCFMDFAGSFQPSDPLPTLIQAGVLDYIIIPIDMDSESRKSAFNFLSFLTRNFPKERRPQCIVFWSRMTARDLEKRYSPISKTDYLLRDLGAYSCKTMIMSNRRLMSAPQSFGFIRTTVCFPYKTIMSQCPYYIELFDEILHIISQL